MYYVHVHLAKVIATGSLDKALESADSYAYGEKATNKSPHVFFVPSSPEYQDRIFTHVASRGNRLINSTQAVKTCETCWSSFSALSSRSNTHGSAIDHPFAQKSTASQVHQCDSP